MMIKPQIATLMFIPLLMQKKYLSIAVAVAMCLIATLWPAYVYGESSLALILQIPKIGAPYETNGLLAQVLPQNVAQFVKVAWILFCVSACAFLSWKWHNVKDIALRFVPVAFIFPYWMYSQAHDRMASWPFVVAMAILLPQIARKGHRFCAFVAIYLSLFAFKNIYSGLWRFCGEVGMTLSPIFGRIYGVVNYPVAITHFAFCLFILWKGPDLFPAVNENHK